MKLYIHQSWIRKPLVTYYYKPIYIGNWRRYLEFILHLLTKYGIQVLGNLSQMFRIHLTWDSHLSQTFKHTGTYL